MRLTESTTARVHFVVHPPKGAPIHEVDTADLERRHAGGVPLLARRLRHRRPQRVRRGGRLPAGPPLRSRPSRRPTRRTSRPAVPRSTSAASRRSRWARTGPASTWRCTRTSTPAAARRGSRSSGWAAPLSLSGILPTLSSMGVEVVDERPYELDGLDRPTFIYEFGLRYGRALPDNSRELFQDAVRAVWEGHNEIDGFNALVLGAGLTWRQATVLRAYAKYMKQGNSPFALDYIEGALLNNVDITRLLVLLFEVRFDPASDRSRAEMVEERIARALDDVASLDHDRILRSYLTLIRRDAAHQLLPAGAADGSTKPYMSFKLEPSAIPDLPEPRPRFEIFVYSPRVEGVHLRFGPVARGGLRWSDRRDDFRTEVLGLVKAQMVKNTVIVPVGAKGGFFCKQLPDPSDRDAWLAEGVRSLPDLHLRPARHHRQPGRRRDRAAARRGPPRRRRLLPRRRGRQGHRDVLRHRQRGRPVATASGSATRSPAAARSATTTRRWASPPRARGSRCSGTSASAASTARPRSSPASASATCPATCSATACSARSTTRLVAAFDHRDIFLDPNPDPAVVVRRAQAPLRPAAVELAGLRPREDLRGRRRLLAVAEVDRAERRRPRGPRHRRLASRR